MMENTKIEWCHHTWNPWQGCHRVSPGCLNCYMFRDKKRFGQLPDTVVRSKARTFNQPRYWHGGGRVFVCSWSDFFIEEADPWRDEAWQIIKECSELPHNGLEFLILTKRPERIRDHLPEWCWPLPNVWLGVTAENQEQADKRLPILLDIPAAMHFVSVEPMLGPVDLKKYVAMPPGVGPDKAHRWPTLDWVICGCESGQGARVTRDEWIRSLLDQCVGEVPFFLKQMRVGNAFIRMPAFFGRVWDQVPGEVK